MVPHSNDNDILRVHISASLEERLKELSNSEEIIGRLYGFEDVDTICLMAMVMDTNNDYAVPSGLSDHACFMTSKCAENSFESINKRIPEHQDTIIVVCNDSKLSVYIRGELTDHQISDNNFKELLLFRINDNLPLYIEFSSDKYIMENNIQEAFDSFRSTITKDKLFFLCSQSSMIIPDDKVNNDKTIEELYTDTSLKKAKRSSYGLNQQLINMKLLLSLGDYRQESVCVPIIEHQHKQFTNYHVTLKIDTLTYAPRHSTSEHLRSLLLTSIDRFLCATKLEFIRNTRDTANSLVSLNTYHFYANAHFLSIIYPDDVEEDSLEPIRRVYHKRYFLSEGRPLLRKACNSRLFDGSHCDGLLLNPHIGVPESKVPGGRVSLVKGIYAYHHYMQNGIDDSGWGCAYRSLQTLASWYRLQGYTQLPIPTHAQIQKTLVTIGDKPAKFENSKLWIGSTEVCYVLDEMFKITSKILFVSSGEDMAMEGRKLANHFDTVGSPIMIGGGVLAHTILGVDFNQDTAAIKYLILDPHYTGAESLETIQDKGWCGWKGEKFWDKNAHYNMCMPQLPDVI